MLSIFQQVAAKNMRNEPNLLFRNKSVCKRKKREGFKFSPASFNLRNRHDPAMASAVDNVPVVL